MKKKTKRWLLGSVITLTFALLAAIVYRNRK